MQRLRGRMYLEDGAIRPCDLQIEGRHLSELDSRSWHLLTLDATGSVVGCTRFRQHPNTVTRDELSVSRAPLSASPAWGPAFHASVDRELESARKAGFVFLEIGGWALAPEIRRSAEALKSVLAIYALGSLKGGAVAIAAATERNASASILRKLGGRPLEWEGSSLPPYYDDNYRCEMEILRFDSRDPEPKYAAAIRDFRSQVAQLPVICPDQVNSWARTARSLVPDFAGLMQPALGTVGA
jgi:hypothetical protein